MNVSVNKYVYMFKFSFFLFPFSLFLLGECGVKINDFSCNKHMSREGYLS
jgi:hypothetical protein